jgi:polyvinyl alcohol dehydrogenase (cytochrome)
MRHLFFSITTLTAFVALVMINASAQQRGPQPPGGLFGPPRGMALFQSNCASCHSAEGVEIGGRVAPTLAALRATAPERIYEAVLSGKMKDQAAKLNDRQKRDVAEYLAGRPIVEDNGIKKMTNACASNPPLAATLTSSLSWNGWSPTPNNARFQTAEAAGLKAEDIPKLKLKWAFGLPGGATSSSQPTVALGRVFVGSDNANVYSMDAKTGCAYWAFHADGAGRFAPIVAPISGHTGSKYAVYFVTSRGTAFAIDAQDGKQLWKTSIEGLVNISNSSAYYDGRLYVPITGTETLSGADPKYECCRSRGGVAALDANTGKIIWKVDSITEPLRKIGVNSAGTQLWGPAGAGVWNTPTIDPKRKRIYVGTGNSYGPIAAETSDSILALSMDDGKLVWSHQEFKGDSFMVGCGNTSPAGGNCPEKLGPDWDFGGSSVIMQRLENGRDVLLAAGKDRVAIALDPDDNGKLLWRTTLYKTPPSPMGLVVFGGTADSRRVYYPLQQPGGGLSALNLDTGKIEWTADVKADNRGQIGAASSIPGVVFTGAWDGTLRAADTNGKVIWTYATNREFESINGIPAMGGSLGSPGPTIAGGMLYVASGYIGVQNGSPGNVILAFGVE